MKKCILSLCLPLLLLALSVPVRAQDMDYLSRMAEQSEIKAIALVKEVRLMGARRDGTLYEVSFKSLYALTPFTPSPFTGGCKAYEYAWQQKSKDMVYFKPRRGDRVYVTVSANGGAITSLTPLTPRLDSVVRKEPGRITYRHGKAVILPRE